MEQRFGIVYPFGKDILHWSKAGILLEIADKPTDADMKFFGIGFNVDGFAEMFVEVCGCFVNFLGYMRAFSCDRGVEVASQPYENLS